MSEYDSILKQKKRVEKIEEKPKKFPKFWVSLFLIMITLIVSYVIYFNQILAPRNILINDLLSVTQQYSNLLKNIPIKEYLNDKNIVGTINYRNEKFDFNLVKNRSDIGFNIASGNQYINYYLVNDKAYVKIPSIAEIVSLKSSFSINTLLELEDKVKALGGVKFIKTVYVKDKKPIVEINFKLKKEELNSLFGLNLVDDYEVLVTLKNSAIMNKLEEIKIVINKSVLQGEEVRIDRKVITYKAGEILYKTTDSAGREVSYLAILQEASQDFKILISKNDELYSVIVGNNTSTGYHYTYQIMNQIYKFEVLATKNIDGYTYDISKKVKELEEQYNLNLKIEEGYIIENNIVNVIDEENGLITERYNSDINYFKDRWLKFIN